MNTLLLRDKIKLGLPFENLKYNAIAQFFGVNGHWYKRYDLKGHNGIDHLAPKGVPVLAVCDGVCAGIKTTKEGYGIYVRQFSDVIKYSGDKLDIIYGHLEKVALNDGQSIKKGQVIGYADNTGYSFGNHLHLGVRIIDSTGKVRDYDNGFMGYFDHYPLLENPISWMTYRQWKKISGTTVPEWEVLPVGKKYNIEGIKRLPWTSYIWLGIKLKRQITEQEHNALAYGRWDFNAVFNRRVGEWFRYYTKDEYNKRIKNNLGL